MHRGAASPCGRTDYSVGKMRAMTDDRENSGCFERPGSDLCMSWVQTDTESSARTERCYNYLHFRMNFDWGKMSLTVHSFDGTDFDTEKHWSCRNFDQIDTGSD